MERWVEIATRELGVTEKAGKATNARITEYFAVAGHKEVVDDETAWCSAFVNYCFEKADMKGTLSLAARSWERFGKHCDPTPGCVLIWKRGKSTWQGHVNLLLEILPDGRFLCIGGNQGNAVSKRIYSKAQIKTQLVDSRWPSTMSTSRTIKASAVGGTATMANFVAEQASDLQMLSEQAREYVSWAGYLALACAAIAFIAVVRYKYLDIQEKG